MRILNYTLIFFYWNTEMISAYASNRLKKGSYLLFSQM